VKRLICFMLLFQLNALAGNVPVEEPEEEVIHPYAELAKIIMEWPKFEVPRDLDPTKLSHDEICNLVQQVVEGKKKNLWKLKEYGINLCKALGYVTIFSGGVIFTFFVCAFCNEYPWLIQRWYSGAQSDAPRPAFHRRTGTMDSLRYFEPSGRDEPIEVVEKVEDEKPDEEEDEGESDDDD